MYELRGTKMKAYMRELFLIQWSLRNALVSLICRLSMNAR